MTIFITLLTFIGLLWSANHLVAGAAGVANYYRIPPLLIGLFVVSLGTTVPEMMIAITGASEGKNDLVFGNAIGSNIANIGLVLGLTILLRPLSTNSSLLRREYPLLFLIMLFAYSLMLDGYLGVIDGCLFLIGCILLIGYLVYFSYHKKNDPFINKFQDVINGKRSLKTNLMSLAIGVIILPLSAHFLVENVAHLANWLGMSELVIGLTIVSFGTSLPELVTAIVAATKGQDDLAVGTILGSNMFNMLAIMAFPSLINPSAISNTILWRDIPVMLIVTLIILFLNYQFKEKMARWQGGLLRRDLSLSRLLALI